VLDEPNSNLDEEGERALSQALKSLKANGSTVFMVSHRQGAIPISDYMLILRNGAVERQGPTPKVVAEIQEIMAQRKQQAATKGIAKPIDSAAGT
jgi:ABC-type protease/lipase transport system fused ATPase/permease subunit